MLQGDILSPLLFAIFLADLEDFLKARGIRGVLLARLIRIILLVYADDIVLLALAWHEMKQIIWVIREYCEINLLTLNAKKTNVLVFIKGGRNYKKLFFSYDKEKIYTVNNYEYLGIIFDRRGLFHLAASKPLASPSRCQHEISYW